MKLTGFNYHRSAWPACFCFNGMTLLVHRRLFDARIRSASQCPSAAQDGNLGQIMRGQTTPEFERALVVLSSGEICAAPIETRYGLHIVRLDRVQNGTILPYEAVESRIVDYLRERVQRRAQAQYIARLVSSADILGVALAGAESHRVH